MNSVQEEIPLTHSAASAGQREPASFRDPSGFIFHRDGIVYRQVNPIYAQNYQRLMKSGLYEHLVKAGDLLPHDEQPDQSDAYKILRHRQLDLISYPYEWSFSQLKDAALLTLRIHQSALKHEMVLKDASAYNVQFDRGRAVFIDTLSFDEYREGEPWIAYAQFCRHFLAPLALMSRVDFRLGQLLRTHVDGIPLDLASKLLPWRTRFSVGLGLHLHAHAASQRRHADSGDGKSVKAATISRTAMNNLVQNLIDTVTSLDWNPGKTEWGDYYTANHNYGDAGLDQKEKTLRQLLTGVDARTIWDLGGNTGRFSRAAASQTGASAVTWDIDPACVEANYRHVKAQAETNILPLLLDLTNPSPALGWANCERRSFIGRGPVDVVLALGLIHHLAISNNVPLANVAAMFSQMGKTLIIEFVPKKDSQVKRLLATRQDIFGEYHREGFESAFGDKFEIESRLEIPGTVRSLYRMKSRAVR